MDLSRRGLKPCSSFIHVNKPSPRQPTLLIRPLHWFSGRPSAQSSTGFEPVVSAQNKLSYLPQDRRISTADCTRWTFRNHWAQRLPSPVLLAQSGWSRWKSWCLTARGNGSGCPETQCCLRCQVVPSEGDGCLCCDRTTREITCG